MQDGCHISRNKFPETGLIAACTPKKMDYFRMAVSLILVAVFFYLFGYWSIIRLMDDGITVSQSQIEPENIKPPGISLLIL